MNRLLPSPVLTGALLVLWLLLNDTLSLGHVVLGLFLGLAIPLICRSFRVGIPAMRRPDRLLLYILMVAYDIVAANLSVARLILGSRKRLKPAFIEVPLTLEDEFLVTVLASVISLTPGTVSADLDLPGRRLLVHALDAPDPEALIAELKQRYEAPLLEIFACSTT